MKSQHNAQLLRRDIFAKTGLQARVIEGEESAPIYRVRLGPVESPEHLEQLLETLENGQFAAPYLVYEKPVTDATDTSI